MPSNLPKGVSGRIVRLAHTMNTYADRVSAVLMAAAGLVLLMQVVLRYAFSTGFAWSEELARYMIIYVSLIGSSVVISVDGHPRVDALLEWLPVNVRRYTRFALDFATLGFLCVLTWQGAESMMFGLTTRTPALQVPWAWAYASVPIGGILMAIQVLCRMVESLYHLQS